MSNRLPILAAQIKTAHQAATIATQSALDHARDAGAKLIEAKTLLDHGQWLPWLREAGVSARTAQKYMRLARIPEDKYAATAHLSIDRALDAFADVPVHPAIMHLHLAHATYDDAIAALEAVKTETLAAGIATNIIEAFDPSDYEPKDEVIAINVLDPLAEACGTGCTEIGKAAELGDPAQRKRKTTAVSRNGIDKALLRLIDACDAAVKARRSACDASKAFDDELANYDDWYGGRDIAKTEKLMDWMDERLTLVDGLIAKIEDIGKRADMVMPLVKNACEAAMTPQLR